MEKSSRSDLRSTKALNARALIAKEKRRIEKANLPIEEKMEVVRKLRDATRELRTNSRVVKKGSVIKD